MKAPAEKKKSYNHTFPEYLISTLPHPRRMYRHTHRPRKRKIAPKQPLLLSPVVRLITPPCYPPWIHCSTTNKTLDSNFGEPGVGRLARCFFFILNFMLVWSFRDGVSIVIRGCVRYTLSIMLKFRTEPHFQLAVLNFR